MTAGVKRIERANMILAVAFTALAGVVWGPRGTLAAAAGRAARLRGLLCSGAARRPGGRGRA